MNTFTVALPLTFTGTEIVVFGALIPLNISFSPPSSLNTNLILLFSLPSGTTYSKVLSSRAKALFSSAT